MGSPGHDQQDPNAVQRFRDLGLESGNQALTELFHELKVHQEELSAQNHQLIETQHALEESRDRYLDLYDFAPIGYMTINASGLIREINFAGAALLGRERGKIVGLPFNAFVVTADKSTFSEHLRLCRQFDREYVTNEVRLTAGDPPTCVQLVTRPLKGESGDAVPLLLTAMIDLTAQRRLERERREMEDAREKLARDREFARARADAKDHFLAMLSHELRTPLTPVVATISNERLISLAPEPLRAALHTVRRNLELEVRLIDDLLDVTRISRDRLLLTQDQVDLHLIVQEVVDMLDVETRREGITVITQFDAPTHTVVGDPVRLRQVFWNLLGNAIKFAGRDGTVKVSSAAGMTGFVQITVSDTGIGMERDLVNAINTPDETSRFAPLQSSTGLGLGLAICRGVINAHGGTLRAVSAGAGRGSAFTVQIPIAGPPAEEDRHTAAAQPASDHPSRRLKILLVEDHQDSAETLSQLLTLHDYDVSVANNVESAIDVALAGFDLLISDIRLPDGNGLDLMRRLRSTQPIRGIAISGFGTEQDRRRSRDAGYDMHLTKPVDFNRLLEAIERTAPARQSSSG